MSLLDPSRALLRLTELQQGFTDAARLSLTLSDLQMPSRSSRQVTIARRFGTQSQQLGRSDFAERRMKAAVVDLRRRFLRGRGGGHRRSRRVCLLRRRDASADLASGGAPFHGGRDLFPARVFDPRAQGRRLGATMPRTAALLCCASPD
jgi:hypothetical protein